MDNKKVKLGILGGGQLARMMIPTLKKWDLSFCVLDSDDCVASPFTSDRRIGNFRDPEDVKLLSDCERVTFDLEDISLEGIKQLESSGCQVFPSPLVMEIIQDKGRQKDFFLENQIPTSSYQIVDKDFDLLPPGFIKKCTGGYDGKGVFSWKKESPFPDEFKTRVVWEEKVDFKKELSVIVARDSSGHTLCYKPVDMVFNSELNLIDYTFSPANISSDVSKKATLLAKEIANKINHVGVLAVEMFLLKDNSLLVNELAPRPHNSGHHTIESCLTSQFENHLRAVCGFPLGECEQKTPYALTFNILASGVAGSTLVTGLKDVLSLKNTHVHLYGKKEARPGRKMGHVTILDSSQEGLIKKYKQAKKLIKIEGQ